MGRACVILLCSVFLTLTPVVIRYGWAEAPPDQWEHFIAQYRLLQADGKYALAERLWNNNYEEMEQYARTLPPEYQETWRKLIEGVSSTEGHEGSRRESLFIILETASSRDPQQLINHKVQELAIRVTDKTVSHSTLQKEWLSARPLVGFNLNEAELLNIDQSFVKLSERDSLAAREVLSQRMESLLTTTDEVELVALFSTAMMIGGSIVMTLVYVATRKYKGSSKNRHKMKSGHS